MRRLNRRATGRRRLTDVIAFALPQPDGTLLGDVYICPDAARGWLNSVPEKALPVAETAGNRQPATPHLDEELVRLAVHGTLHVLGYDHPDGPGRTRSAMWRRQERYVRRLRNSAAGWGLRQRSCGFGSPCRSPPPEAAGCWRRA